MARGFSCVTGRPKGITTRSRPPTVCKWVVQKYGYALFFMTDAALKYLDKSDGWELGSAPGIVIVDEGAAGGISTTSAQSDMYAFFFSQKGLMAGLGLQGTKISKIKK